MSRIAFLGLGNMGLPMATKLATAGHDVVGQPGFAAALMLKDLGLAQDAADGDAATPLGAHAARLHRQLVAEGAGGKDFSFAYPWLAQKSRDDVP